MLNLAALVLLYRNFGKRDVASFSVQHLYKKKLIHGTHFFLELTCFVYITIMTYKS